MLLKFSSESLFYAYNWEQSIVRVSFNIASDIYYNTYLFVIIGNQAY
jgi:hypothetical protein